MSEYGYDHVLAFDGEVRDGYFAEYPRPVSIGRHRPDCISANNNGKMAIGEAKTESDLSSERTYEELFDFTTACCNSDEYEKLFFGYPSTCSTLVKRLMFKLPEINREVIITMEYPIALDDQNEE